MDARIANAKSESEFAVMYALFSMCNEGCPHPALCRVRLIKDAAALCRKDADALITLSINTENSIKLTDEQKMRICKHIDVKNDQLRTWLAMLWSAHNEFVD